MLDERRILVKIDELDAYLMELRAVAPDSFEEYEQIEKKRSCERLLQLCIQCVIDINRIMVSGLRLGLPADENDLFVKLQKKGIVSAAMAPMDPGKGTSHGRRNRDSCIVLDGLNLVFEISSHEVMKYGVFNDRRI